jgi:hypothetical protein
MSDKTMFDQLNDELQLLQLAFLKKARAAVEGEMGFAMLSGSGQSSTHQTSENISQNAGRTQTETAHTDDMNAIERMKVTVARGADDNQVISGAVNAAVAQITQASAFGLSGLMVGASVVNNQINANVADINHKNSNFGRGMGVLGILGVADAVEESTDDTDKK